jgi:hypothetical protein
MRIIFVFCISSILILACSHKEKIPAGILPPEKMQSVLWDMIGAGEYITTFVAVQDSVDKELESLKMYEQVLRAHHTTRDQFKKSFSWYRSQPVLMRTMIDTLSKRAAKLGPPNMSQKSDSLLKKKIITPVKEN